MFSDVNGAGLATHLRIHEQDEALSSILQTRRKAIEEGQTALVVTTNTESRDDSLAIYFPDIVQRGDSRRFLPEWKGKAVTEIKKKAVDPAETGGDIPTATGGASSHSVCKKNAWNGSNAHDQTIGFNDVPCDDGGRYEGKDTSGVSTSLEPALPAIQSDVATEPITANASFQPCTSDLLDIPNDALHGPVIIGDDQNPEEDPEPERPYKKEDTHLTSTTVGVIDDINKPSDADFDNDWDDADLDEASLNALLDRGTAEEAPLAAHPCVANPEMVDDEFRIQVEENLDRIRKRDLWRAWTRKIANVKRRRHGKPPVETDDRVGELSKLPHRNIKRLLWQRLSQMECPTFHAYTGM